MTRTGHYRDSIAQHNYDEQCMWVLRNARSRNHRYWAATLLSAFLKYDELTPRQEETLRGVIAKVEGNIAKGDVVRLRADGDDDEVLE